MKPALSIIIPSHNHADCLPTLLNSILAQSLQDLEVILVDDCSDTDCQSIVSEFMSKGLNIHYYRSEQRLYTKDARLKGIELAKADIITFADADDYYVSEKSLENFVRVYHESGCDILHFRSLRADHTCGTTVTHYHFDPYCTDLDGDEIFAWYVTKFDGVLWNKLYSRKIWLKLLEVAKSINITIRSEDFFLTSLFLFHAKKYKGVIEIGYLYNDSNKIAHKYFGRAQAHFIMNNELIPYFKTNDCRSDLVKYFQNHLEHSMQRWTNSSCLTVAEGQSYSDDIFSKFKEVYSNDCEQLLSILVASAIQNSQTLLCVPATIRHKSQL